MIGVVVRPLVKFAYRAFLLGGVRDGIRGLIKVGLDCGADSGAQLLAIRRGRDDAVGPAFGQEAPRVGPVRIVGAALTRGRAERVAAWLRGARAAGADVWQIAPTQTEDLPGRELEGSGPGAFVRALDAADQLRPIDAILVAGRPERLWLRFAPRALRGTVPALVLGCDPAATTEALQESRQSAPEAGTGTIVAT